MTATEQNRKNMRTLLMFILATLAVIVVIGVLFIANIRQSQRNAIVLPDAAQSQPQESRQPDAEEAQLLRVDRENVQNIVRYLHRPQYYHQTYSITRRMHDAASQTTAELWVSDTRICAILTTGGSEKHILTDGQTLYVWYAGDEQVRELSVSPDMTMDELIGIPTYELVGTIPSRSITDGAFISDETNGQQIYVSAEEDDVQRECWVSLEYGLLTQSIQKNAGQTVYNAVQTGLEILAAGDEVFDDVFLLPDGSSPFD